MKEGLKDISANNDLSYFVNRENISNHDLLLATIQYFEKGVGKDFFELLEFLNLLLKQYMCVKIKHGDPVQSFERLKTLLLSDEQKQYLFGFILKWCGGYPVATENKKINEATMLIQHEFLNNAINRTETKFFQKSYRTLGPIDKKSENSLKSFMPIITRVDNPNIKEYEQAEIDALEKVKLNSPLNDCTNKQIVLIFHYFFRSYRIERSSEALVPIAKFINLILGKEITKITNSETYKLLRKAPRFDTKESLIKDLVVIRPFFDRLQLKEIVGMIDKDIVQAKII